MIEQTCDCIGKRDQYGYAFMLRELVRHLRELRDRHAAGDAQVVYEFFDLYIVDEKRSDRDGD